MTLDLAGYRGPPLRIPSVFHIFPPDPSFYLFVGAKIRWRVASGGVTPGAGYVSVT